MIDNSNINLKLTVEKKRTFNITTNKSFSQKKEECQKSLSPRKTPSLLNIGYVSPRKTPSLLNIGYVSPRKTPSLLNIGYVSPRKAPSLLSIGYVPKKKDNINKNKSSTILHLMDYNNAEEEIKNAINEMKKGLILEMKNNSNDLIYLIDENKEKEKLINIKNINHLNIPNFNKKEYTKVNNGNIDINSNNKNSKNIEIKNGFESKNGNKKNLKSIYKFKNKTIIEDKYRILSHGCLIIDSNDDNESDEELDSNEYYINPETNIFFIYDFIIALGVFYSLLYLPYELANSLCICNPNINYIKVFFNIFIEILFLFDLIINFFLGYYNEEDKLIKRSKKIIKNYILGYFIVDLLSSIPFNTISFYYCKKNNYQICHTYENNNIILLLLTCLKAIKIFKIFGRKKNQFITKIIEKCSDLIFLEDLINILSNIFFVVLGFHIASCIHIYIGRHTFPSWIHKNEFQNDSTSILYIISIYYIITTMTTVGYGDIQGDSFLEIIFRLILLAIGIIIYSWLISSISNSINKESFASINYSNECKVLEEIRITHSKLPYSLYSKIINYLKNKHFYQTKYDKNLLIKCLPYTLKNELYLSMYKLPLKRFHFFKGISNTNFLVDILSYYSPKTASKDEILIKEDDIIEEIIYVREGKLSLEIPINIDNPEESINKYLSYDFLEYAFNLDYNYNYNQNNNHNNTNLSICSNKTNISFNQTNLTNITNIHNKNNEKEEEIIDKNIYLKIHNVLKNEDYGSIFMFFGKRSPFSVKVKSKKVKLFALKKADFNKLCSQYKNVIRRIQKKKKKDIKMVKSIFIKIIARFCDIKGIKIDGKFMKTIKRAITKLNKEIIPKDILKNIEIDEDITDSLNDFDSKLSFFQSSLSSNEKKKLFTNLKKSFSNIENYKSLLYREFILSNKYESKYYSYSKGKKLNKKLNKSIKAIKEKMISKISSNSSYKKRFYFSESDESETIKFKSESGPNSMNKLPESLKISLKKKIMEREKEDKESSKKKTEIMNERHNYSSYSTFKNINNYINHQKLIHKYNKIRRFSGTNLCSSKKNNLILDDLDYYQKSESFPKEISNYNSDLLLSTSVESFKIESSYKNLNEITDGKFIKNKKLQSDTLNYVKNYDIRKISCKKIDKSSKKGNKIYTLSYENQKTRESKNDIILNKKLHNKLQNKSKLNNKFSNKNKLYKNDITTNENIQSNIKYRTLSSESNSTQKEIYINSFHNNNISNSIKNINNLDFINKIVQKNEYNDESHKRDLLNNLSS